MLQLTEELTDSTVERARQFINLQQGKNAEKGWAASALLNWLVETGIDDAETTLTSITEASFTQPVQNPDSEDYSETNWITVLRAMEERGLGKLVLGRHGWPTRFSWKNGSSLNTACAVLGRPQKPKTKQPQTTAAITKGLSGPIPPTRLSIGRIEVRLPLGGASEEEWAELVRWVTRRGS